MRSKAFLIAAALLALPALQGCGFTPMYAKPGLGHTLADIAIDTPQTRTGFFLGQDLRQTLNNDDTSAKTYTLKILMSEDHFNIGYRIDDTSTRSEITSTVIYTLTDNRSGKAIYSDHFTETVTYASTSSPFTGIVSQQNGQERLADAVSTRIQGALAVYFHEH